MSSPPVHGREASQSSTGNAAICHHVENRVVRDISVSIRWDLGECLFHRGFH